MAIKATPNAKEALVSRIKKPADWEKLNKIIDAQSKNKNFNIKLSTLDGKSLDAIIDRTHPQVRDNHFFLEENFFSRLFKSPVKFIEKCAKLADKESTKIENILPTNPKHQSILDKMKE